MNCKKHAESRRERQITQMEATVVVTSWSLRYSKSKFKGTEFYFWLLFSVGLAGCKAEWHAGRVWWRKHAHHMSIKKQQ